MERPRTPEEVRAWLATLSPEELAQIGQGVTQAVLNGDFTPDDMPALNEFLDDVLFAINRLIGLEG